MLRLIVFIVVGAVIYLAATNQLESTLVRWELADKEMRKISCTPTRREQKPAQIPR